MGAGSVGERVLSEPIVRVSPGGAEAQSGHDRQIAAHLQTLVAGAPGVPIEEPRRRDLIGNQRVTHLGLKQRDAIGEPAIE